MLTILLHWSSIREMRGDTTTIALPPAADLPDILYSKQTEESGSIVILTPPGRCDGSHTKTSHRSIAGRCSSSIQERLAARGHRRARSRPVVMHATTKYSLASLTVRITLSTSTSQVYRHNRTSTVPVEFHR